jgi:protein arginine N-methyltransferase 2
MATEEDIEALSVLGGYLIFSILYHRPLPKILTLIDAGAPLWYQDDEGTSPLHAAAYTEDEELVRILIEKGAIWNAGRMKWPGIPRSCSTFPCLAVDNLHNTAADIALSMNNENCYRLIRDAGIRSGEPTWIILPKNLLRTAFLELLLDLISSKPSLPASIVLRAEDDTATGSTEAFLSSKLQYTQDEHGQEICLLRDGDKQVGVMMGWERDISEHQPLPPSRRSAQELLGTPKCERR